MPGSSCDETTAFQSQGYWLLGPRARERVALQGFQSPAQAINLTDGWILASFQGIKPRPHDCCQNPLCSDLGTEGSLLPWSSVATAGPPATRNGWVESYRWACGWAQLCHARGWVGKGRSSASPTPCALIHLTFLKAEPRLREECVAAAEHIWLQFGLHPSISQGLPFPNCSGHADPGPSGATGSCRPRFCHQTV